jgi:phenylacetate-CoA ligase
MNKIPFTTANDLQEKTKSFFSVPEDKFVTVFTTAGTTGKPKKVYFTKKDIEKIITSTITGLQLMYSVTSRDVVRLSFAIGYGAEISGSRYCLSKAYEGIGALTVAPSRLGVEEELEIFKDYKPTIFMDVSSRINYLTNEMKKIYDLKKLGMKKILLGAEPTPNTMRKFIEESWNADVFIGYGTSETGVLQAGECEEKNGMHLNEFNFFTEVVDPKTGEILEDGNLGEFIFTNYDREGMPLIRYRTRDLGRIIPDMCPCGLPFKRMVIKGRVDDMISIGAGDNLYTRRFDDILFEIPEVIEYQVFLDRKNIKDEITIVVETEIITDSLSKRILEAVMEMPEINSGVLSSKTIEKPVIKLVKPSTFDRNSIKQKRLIDNRNLYD